MVTAVTRSLTAPLSAGCAICKGTLAKRHHRSLAVPGAAAPHYGCPVAAPATSQLPLQSLDRTSRPAAGRTGHLPYPGPSRTQYAGGTRVDRHAYYPGGLRPGRHNADAEASCLRAVEHAAHGDLVDAPLNSARAALPSSGAGFPGAAFGPSRGYVSPRYSRRYRVGGQAVASALPRGGLGAPAPEQAPLAGDTGQFGSGPGPRRR
jgi:hypothetical protein